MPTYEFPESFYREFRKLPPSLRDASASSEGHAGVCEMTFAADGRATFEYGEPQRTGEAHVKWRRIGDHSILDRP